MDLKKKLIDEVADEMGLTREEVKNIVNHQFLFIKMFIQANQVGEIHLPHIGRLVSTEGRVKYLDKIRKEGKEKAAKKREEDEASRN